MEDLHEKIARDQGLGPVIDGLRTEKIPHSIVNTGGWTMVVYVPLGNGLEIGITDAGEEFCLQLYEAEEWIPEADYRGISGMHNVGSFIRAMQATSSRDEAIATFTSA